MIGQTPTITANNADSGFAPSEFEVGRLPWSSATTADVMAAGRRKNHVAAFLEFDVTIARERIREIESQKGIKVSFTGWLAHCVSQALMRHPSLNVHKHGSRKFVRFRDVDVMLIVEREVSGRARPLPLVLRDAGVRSVFQIDQEIRAAQRQNLDESDMVAGKRRGTHWLARVPGVSAVYPFVPASVRGLFWRVVARDAFLAKRVMGTVGITAVGMFGRFPGWPLTTGLHTINVVVGGVVKKPAVVGDAVEVREMLALTLLADHDLVDGAPAARFVTCLGELIEGGHGLLGE